MATPALRNLGFFEGAPNSEELGAPEKIRTLGFLVEMRAAKRMYVNVKIGGESGDESRDNGDNSDDGDVINGDNADGESR